MVKIAEASEKREDEHMNGDSSDMPEKLKKLELNSLHEYNKYRQKQILMNGIKNTVYSESTKIRRMSTMKTIRDDLELLKEKEEDEAIVDDDGAVNIIIHQKIKPNCWGNLPVSLFWEEKLVLLIKLYQFFGFFIMIFFEIWPNQYKVFTGYFCIGTLNIYMIMGENTQIGKQRQYYNMLQTFDPNFWTYMFNFWVFVIIILAGILMFFNKRFNRWNVSWIVNHVRIINFFKLYMWLVDVI